MKSLKKIFSSKNSKAGDTTSSSKPAADHPLSTPRLTPGVYGSFPSQFSIYFAGPGQAKKTDHFYLATDEDGRVNPLNLFTAHTAMVKLQVILYAGTDLNSAPLGLAGTEKFFSSTSVIGLPVPAGGEGGNQIERMTDQKKLKFAILNFSVGVGVGAGQEKGDFEWRSDHLFSTKPREMVEYRLSRLGADGTEGEVVGIWSKKLEIGEDCKMGTFRFQGSGATGELGEYWTLMAVMSVIRLCQVDWVAKGAAEGFFKAGGKLAGAGLGFAV
ncbi:uncharacterized protein GIQ15_04426 [Arthroderma uncinatum]|uniref:uncharacterized protein n=1 Tax=Arthroderma uncinatum TaxID=74035 RepID=UPI00144AEDCA|nr:uncharacterized protein GIQ15_04426 [Arthroderma uncinatum]KAF3481667.1 hypothetical protein GIQ15_04426 [Arthroderma uncinatum]